MKIALLDIDDTLIYDDNGMDVVNYALLDSLIEQGISDIILFSNFNIAGDAKVHRLNQDCGNEHSMSRQQLISHIEDYRGGFFNLHAVVSNRDPGYSAIKNDYKIGDVYHDFSALYDLDNEVLAEQFKSIESSDDNKYSMMQRLIPWLIENGYHDVLFYDDKEENFNHPEWRNGAVEAVELWNETADINAQLSLYCHLVTPLTQEIAFYCERESLATTLTKKFDKSLENYNKNRFLSKKNTFSKLEVNTFKQRLGTALSINKLSTEEREEFLIDLLNEVCELTNNFPYEFNEITIQQALDMVLFIQQQTIQDKSPRGHMANTFKQIKNELKMCEHFPKDGWTLLDREVNEIMEEFSIIEY